jgi:hypothetical protein
MTLTVKSGVRIRRLHVEYVAQLPLICSTIAAYGQEPTITSGNDGKHMTGSLHYTDPLCALDWRTWNIRDVELCAAELRQVLPDKFDVVVEKTHIHIELDDKSGGPPASGT